MDQIPGLVKVDVSRIARTLTGEEDNVLLAQMHFPAADGVEGAMASLETVAAGTDAIIMAGIFTKLHRIQY